MKQYFSQFGEVTSVNLKVDNLSGRSRGFAFVTFAQPSVVQQVMSTTEHSISDRRVETKLIKFREAKVFIGGLKPDMSDSDIRSHFDTFGKISQFDLPKDRNTQQRKNFGFITFENEADVRGLLKIGKTTIGGVDVGVKKAEPRGQQAPAAGAGYGGGAGGYGYGSGGGYGAAGGYGDSGYSAGYGGYDEGYGGYGGGYEEGYGAGYDDYGYGGGYDEGYGGGAGGYGAYGATGSGGYGGSPAGGGFKPRGARGGVRGAATTPVRGGGAAPQRGGGGAPRGAPGVTRGGRGARSRVARPRPY